MKTLKALLFLLSMSAVCLACSDDDEGDDNGGGNSGGGNSNGSVKLESSVPVNGAADVAATTKTIELKFTGDVNYASGASADFNGEKVTLSNFTKSVSDASNVKFNFPSSLKKGSTYTLTVPDGFFTAKSDGSSVAGFSVTFSTQEPTSPSVTASELVTPNPSPEAVKVFEYLGSVYGSKILSASMSNVNWNFDEAEMVYKATGKYPAIATMDYIHMYTQRADWDNQYWVIDYTKMDDVKEWWANNGLLAASWHWMVPTESGAIPTSGDNKLTTKPEETSFKPSNMFIDGTWENGIMKTELEIMANNLLLLKEAGIPLIWRPFHEASGNTNAGNGVNAWFWWGREGAETYKKLWRYVFDYFQEKGLNNLIWVWTTQTGYNYKKKIADDADWYPGDEYVDIIGRDEYTMTAEQSVAEYKAICETFPGKIVTLSECGSVAKLSEQFNAGATWSWAMPWYDYNADNTTKTLDGHSHADTNWWKDAMSCENVITRDQLPSMK